MGTYLTGLDLWGHSLVALNGGDGSGNHFDSDLNLNYKSGPIRKSASFNNWGGSNRSAWPSLSVNSKGQGL